MALTDSTISTKFLIDPLDLIQDEWTRKGSKMKSKNKIYLGNNSRKKQARKPRSYASPKLRLTDSLTDLLTGVKCRATSIAKNCKNDHDEDIYIQVKNIHDHI